METLESEDGCLFDGLPFSEVTEAWQDLSEEGDKAIRQRRTLWQRHKENGWILAYASMTEGSGHSGKGIRRTAGYWPTPV